MGQGNAFGLPGRTRRKLQVGYVIRAACGEDTRGFSQDVRFGRQQCFFHARKLVLISLSPGKSCNAAHFRAGCEEGGPVEHFPNVEKLAARFVVGSQAQWHRYDATEQTGPEHLQELAGIGHLDDHFAFRCQSRVLKQFQPAQGPVVKFLVAQGFFLVGTVDKGYARASLLRGLGNGFC
jgi:hypothetical protein